MDALGQDKRTAAAWRRFRYSAVSMPNLRRIVCCVLAMAVLGGCAAAGNGRPDEPAAGRDTRRAAGGRRCRARAAGLSARGELLPRAAERSDDERVAEQATRVAYDNRQQRETAAAAERWLELNPTNEQARRYAGVAALRAAPARRRRHALRRAARDGVPESRGGLSRAVPGDRRRGYAGRRDGAVPAPGRAPPQGRRRTVCARRQPHCARRISRLRSSQRATRHADRSVLGAGAHAARARA